MVVPLKAQPVQERPNQLKISLRLLPYSVSSSIALQILVIRLWLSSSKVLLHLDAGIASMSSTELILRYFLLLPSKCWLSEMLLLRMQEPSFSKALSSDLTRLALLTLRWTPVTLVALTCPTTWRPNLDLVLWWYLTTFWLVKSSSIHSVLAEPSTSLSKLSPRWDFHLSSFLHKIIMTSVCVHLKPFLLLVVTCVDNSTGLKIRLVFVLLMMSICPSLLRMIFLFTMVSQTIFSLELLLQLQTTLSWMRRCTSAVRSLIFNLKLSSLRSVLSYTKLLWCAMVLWLLVVLFQESPKSLKFCKMLCQAFKTTQHLLMCKHSSLTLSQFSKLNYTEHSMLILVNGKMVYWL